jgi:hypothetical protein
LTRRSDVAVRSASVTVPATPGGILLAAASGDRDGVRVVVEVNTGGQSVFLGGSDVTTANGLQVASGAKSHEIVLARGESLYGIVAGTTQVVRVFKTSAL